MRMRKMLVGACALLAASACKIDNSSDSTSKTPAGITGPTTPSGADTVVTGLNGLPDTLTLWTTGSCGPSGSVQNFVIVPSGANQDVDPRSDNSNVVTASQTAKGTLSFTAKNAGHASVTVVSISNSAVFKVVKVGVLQCNPQPTTATVSLNPATGSGSAGTTITVTASVSTGAACTWSTPSGNSTITQQSATQATLMYSQAATATTLTCSVPNGSGSGTYTSTGPASSGTFVGVTPANATFPCSASPSFKLLDQNGNPITSGITWSVSGGGSINSSGVMAPTATGTFTVSGQYQGVNYTTQVTINGSCAQTPVFTSVTPNNQTLTLVCNNGAGSVTGPAFQALDQNGAVMSGTPTVMVASGPQGGVSLSGATPTYTQAGTYTFNVTLGGVTKQATETVTGTCTQQSISISPTTFGPVVAGSSQTFTVTTPGAYTPSTSNTACALLSSPTALVPKNDGSGLYTSTFTLTPNNGCPAFQFQGSGSQILSVTATLTSNGQTATANGSVSVGNVTCVISVAGLNNSTNPPSLTMQRSTSAQGSVTCTNQNGVGFLPFISDDNTNSLRIQGSQFIDIQNPNGTTTRWTVGTSFTMIADNPSGGRPVNVYAQQSLTNTAVIGHIQVNVP